MTDQRQDGHAGSPKGEKPAQPAKAAWLPLAMMTWAQNMKDAHLADKEGGNILGKGTDV